MSKERDREIGTKVRENIEKNFEIDLFAIKYICIELKTDNDPMPTK